jgi:hypothetical protein
MLSVFGGALGRIHGQIRATLGFQAQGSREVQYGTCYLSCQCRCTVALPSCDTVRALLFKRQQSTIVIEKLSSGIQNCTELITATLSHHGHPVNEQVLSDEQAGC